MKKRLLWLGIPTLIGIMVISCQKDEISSNVEAKDNLVTFAKTVIDENSKKINESLKTIAENLSKTDKSIYEKISENALKRNDGDNDFIYHKDKSLFGRNAINTIEEGVNSEGLNNPYLNIYVYKGLNNENQDLKPYVFYFPVGIKDTEVDSLIGFIDGKLVKIDAKNPPEDIKNPIFVVGENERMHEVELANDDSFVVNNKVYAIKERYLTNRDKTPDNLTKRGGGKMRVTFSRFGSMSDKRYYEPWGKGDAEVRFIFNKSFVRFDNYVTFNPINNMNVETSSALIDGGYMYRSWWNYYSKDNYTTTPYFVDFYEDNIPAAYTMTLIEEDRYWGWIENLLDSSRDEISKFIDFKATLMNDLKIKPNNILEPSVREIYNDLINAENFSDLKASYDKLRTNSNFYFDISNNYIIKSETNIKVSLFKVAAQITLGLLDKFRNTDDHIGDPDRPIQITRENGKVYYSTDGRFRFKLEY